MRRLFVVLTSLLLVTSLAGSSLAATPASGRSHAFGHFLIGLADRGPIGWVTVDIWEPTSAQPDPGLFMFEALPGVTDFPVTTRGAIGYVDFYRETSCCGNPASLVIAGLELQYFVDENGPWANGRDFLAGFYDVGPSRASGDFFRYGLHLGGGVPEDPWPEFYVVSGSLTVALDSDE
jgi:hypothetical protein